MKPWIPHLTLLAALAGMQAWSASAHQSEDALWSLVDEGSSPQRIEALHTLASRPSAQPSPAWTGLAEDLLRAEDPLLREYAGTLDLCRLVEKDERGHPRPQQEAIIESATGPLDGAWWLQYVTYRRKVGGSQVGGGKRLSLEEFEWYRAALRGEELPRGLLRRHISGRMRGPDNGPIQRGQ